ncbi:MAG: hypothetical protein ACLQJF_00640 [Candidatus Sulfotelmatobacter sp.]|jgi:hypothetical protein
MATMAKVFTQATCCEVSQQWGVAHSTTAKGRLPENLKCSACGKEYRVEFNEHDPLRIADFESKMRAAAQLAIDRSHPDHGNYVTVNEL